MREFRITFSHLLPLIDLALLVLLVFVPITLTALHIYEASKGSDPVHINTGPFETVFPRSQIVPWAIQIETTPRAHTMMAINLPGALFQWLLSLPTSSSHNSGWHPQALRLETWQALVFPFFALPFWWLVGCGLDGLINNERLHWSLLLTGTLLFALCLTSVIAFASPMWTSHRADVALPAKGFTGWTIGFAALPLAWILQLLRQRRSAKQSGAGRL